MESYITHVVFIFPSRFIVWYYAMDNKYLGRNLSQECLFQLEVMYSSLYSLGGSDTLVVS